MKLLELHVENFGKLHDFNLTFNQGFNTLCYENGFGKTTLASFLKAMFYGMAKKGNNKDYKIDRSRYKPWQGGVYGGSVCFETEKGQFKVVRTFGDTPEKDTFELLDLKTGLNCETYSKTLGYDILNVGMETFEITAFFPQLDIVAHMNDEIRTSLSGAEKFENDLNNFTHAQNIIGDKIKQLKREISSKAKLQDLQEERDNIERQIKVLDATRDDLYKEDRTLIQDQDNLQAQITELEQEQDNYKIIQQTKSKIESDIISKQQQLNEAIKLQKEQKPSKSGLKMGLAFTGVYLIALGIIIAMFFTHVLSLTIALAIFVILTILFIGSFFLPRAVKQESKNSSAQEIDLQNAIHERQLALQKLQNLDFDYDRLKLLQEDKYEVAKKIVLNSSKLQSVDEQQTSLKQRLESLEEELATVDKNDEINKNNIKLLEKTLNFMKKAQENVSARYLAPMQAGFDRYFKKLSNKNIKLDIDYNANEETGVGNKAFEFLSQGYQDAVSICKRLSIIGGIYKGEKPFLVMDDPFVNLDDNNRNVLMQIIKEFAQQHQVIYFCCSQNNT